MLNVCFIYFYTFREKLRRYPLSLCFEHYAGASDDYDSALEYVSERFSAHCMKPDLCTHYTCSTDTTSTKVVFTSVSDIILKQILSTIGLT